MPQNQLPNPKDLLMAQIALPRTIEASLPSGFPQLSGVLLAGANALPDLPTPGLGAAAPGAAGVSDFFSSIESALPSGAPKLSAVLAGGPRPRKEEAPRGVRTRILGSGYRAL